MKKSKILTKAAKLVDSLTGCCLAIVRACPDASFHSPRGIIKEFESAFRPTPSEAILNRVPVTVLDDGRCIISGHWMGKLGPENTLDRSLALLFMAEIMKDEEGKNA